MADQTVQSGTARGFDVTTISTRNLIFAAGALSAGLWGMVSAALAL